MLLRPTSGHSPTSRQHPKPATRSCECSDRFGELSRRSDQVRSGTLPSSSYPARMFNELRRADLSCTLFFARVDELRSAATAGCWPSGCRCPTNGRLLNDLTGKAEAMRKTSFDEIVDGIDRQLSYLHKERWAHRYAELLYAIRAPPATRRSAPSKRCEITKRRSFTPKPAAPP